MAYDGRLTAISGHLGHASDRLSERIDASCTLCPSVHVYDGEQWRYETTLGGTMLVDHAEQLHAGAGKRVRLIPLWVRLDRARLEHERSLRARIVASEDGIAYIDHAALAVIHHPPEHEVVSSSVMQWRVLENRKRERFWAFPTAACHGPQAARWCGELDVREALSQATGVAAAHALDRNNFYDLDFGEVGDGRRACWLLIDGWTFKRERGLPADERGHEPALEIRQADGSYQWARALVAQRGDRKTSAVRLRGLDWPTGRYELRVSTGTGEAGHAMWCLDRVRLGEAPPAPRSIATLAVRRAQLCAPDPASPAPQTYGRFTRYGEVTPLLRESDERMVVMRQGDVLELDFGQVPAAPPGLETSCFLGGQLAYKARVVPGAEGPCALTEQVDPMPRRYMGRYEHDAEPHTHSEFLEYLARWNTREHTRA